MTFRCRLNGGDSDLQVIELDELAPEIRNNGQTYRLLVIDGEPSTEINGLYRYMWRWRVDEPESGAPLPRHGGDENGWRDRWWRP